MDIGTVISIISVAFAIIGMIVAWISESRKTRRATAMDAVANRLLPFYSLILESLSKLNLYMMMYKLIRYKDLGLDAQDFHKKAGEAFVYMTDVNSRQLVVNTIQIIDAIQLIQEKSPSDEIVIAVTKVLPLLGLIKNHVEAYLEEYTNSLNVPSPKLSILKEIANVHTENTLLEVVQLGLKDSS